MRVLRIAVLIPALACFAWPAHARIDTDQIERPSVVDTSASMQQDAVKAALKSLSDADDPVEKIVVEGVRDFYAARDFAPLWLGDRDTTANVTALRAIMDAAADYGLDPTTYTTPELAAADSYDSDGLAMADVEFSQVVARFVTHVASGRIRPSDIGELITLKPERPDISEALTRLSASSDVATDIAAYEPPQDQYRLLKATLAKLREDGARAKRIVVPEGELLKPGERDARVPLLRARLDVPVAQAKGTVTVASAETSGDAIGEVIDDTATAAADAQSAADPEIYDAALVDAVRTFQGEHGLNQDGIVGPNTLNIMNGRSNDDKIASITANLERWRWMPRDLGPFHVFVNVPEFKVRIVEDGTVVHETRVIVGKPTNRTPTFSNEMSHLIVNPYWNVPASIVQNELAPELNSNPAGFARHGYQVFTNVRGKMRQIDPRWVAWYGVGARQLHIRQVPGDNNALGRIKFMFPNQHSVYLHDTPSKSLFKRDFRALSHGCVRVENPFDFADALLTVAKPDWNSDRLKKLFGPAERRVDLDTHVPVHLAYFTDWAEADGTLRHFQDIYGYDGEMSAYLGS